MGWFRRSESEGLGGGFFHLRIDDRLIHGQVVIGYAVPLRVNCLILANDRVASDAGQAEFYRQIIPADIGGRVLSVAEAIQFTPALRQPEGRSLIIVSSVDEAYQWICAQQPPDLLILGGLHAGAGRRRLVDYIYLTDEEVRRLREMAEQQVRILCQDVASGQPVEFEEALRRAKK